MKKLIFGVMFFLIFAPTPIGAQTLDTVSNTQIILAAFKVALTWETGDTTGADFSFERTPNWCRIAVDSTTIMWSADYGKVWPPNDQTGFTFIKEGDVWVLLYENEDEQKIKNLDTMSLVQAIKKLYKK